MNFNEKYVKTKKTKNANKLRQKYNISNTNYFRRFATITTNRILELCDILSKEHGCTEEQIFIDILYTIEGKNLQPMREQQYEATKQQNK